MHGVGNGIGGDFLNLDGKGGLDGNPTGNLEENGVF